MAFNFGAMAAGFVKGWEAGDKSQKSRADRDYSRIHGEYLQSQMTPEMIEAKLGVMKGKIQRMLTGSSVAERNAATRERNSATMAGYRNTMSGIARERLDMDKAAATPIPQAGPQVAPLSPPPKPQSALPMDPSNDVAMYDDEEDDDNEQAARRGGVVRALPHYADGGEVDGTGTEPTRPTRYATGGPVQDDEEGDASEVEDDSDEDDAAGAVPVSAARPATPAGRMPYNAQAAHDAVLAGLKENQAQTKVAADMGVALSAKRRSGALGPRSVPAQEALAQAKGNQIEQIKDKLDEHHQYPESQRSMAAIGAMWQWNLGRGDTRGAEEAAGSMMAYYGAQFNRYKAIAQAAAAKGDVDTTVKAAVKAYDQVLDDQDIDLKKDAKGNYSYTLTNADGKVIERQVLSPDQILGWVTKGGIQSYEQLVAAAAGNREPAKGKGDAGMKPGDMSKLGDVMTDAETKHPRPEDAKEPSAEEASGTKVAATRILMDPQNRKSGLLPQEAYGVAYSVVNGALAAPPEKVEGGMMVKVGKGAAVFVPQSQFDELAAMRAAKLPKTDNKPGVVSRTVDSVKGAYKAGIDFAGSGKPREPEAPVQHPSRFALPDTVPLDDAPEGAIPRRGLGER